MCPEDPTAPARVLSQNLTNLFIGWPSLHKPLANSQNMIFHTLDLLRASMFFQLGHCGCHQLLRILLFVLRFHFVLSVQPFRSRLLPRDSLEILQHPALNFCLQFGRQREDRSGEVVVP